MDSLWRLLFWEEEGLFWWGGLFSCAGILFLIKKTANDLFVFVHNNRRALCVGKLSRMVDVA